MGNSVEKEWNGVRRYGLSRYIVPHDSFDWYTRGIAITTLALGCVVGAATWLYHQHLFEAMGLRDVAEYPEVLDQYARLSLLSTGIVVLIAALYITVVAGFLFHRVAGPIYRIRRHMLEVVDGQPVGPLSLRAKDQLGDLCDAYNQLLYKFEVIDAKPTDPSSDV